MSFVTKDSLTKRALDMGFTTAQITPTLRAAIWANMIAEREAEADVQAVSIIAPNAPQAV